MSAKKTAWHREMETVIEALDREGKTGERAPTLLLHSCCGPCSTSVIETLSRSFRVTVFYYNPNIDEREEYETRAAEQRRLLESMPTPIPVGYLEGEYESARFLRFAEALGDRPEGGPRCAACYALRLDRTASEAAARGFEWFAATLSVSPLKNADALNRIGLSAGKKYGVRWLPSDFKKKDGYRRSIELSAEYCLYRQDYCGCSFSRREAEARRRAGN